MKSQNFNKYEELAQEYSGLLSYLDGYSVELQATAPKFFKQITSDISKNYSEIVKVISFNERFETKFELKEKKLERKLIKLEFNAVKIKDKIDRKLLKMQNKLKLLPHKLELTKAKVEYEKELWVYFFSKIKIWFITWIPILERKNKEKSNFKVKKKNKTKDTTK